jgi:hypothetical protein
MCDVPSHDGALQQQISCENSDATEVNKTSFSLRG